MTGLIYTFLLSVVLMLLIKYGYAVAVCYREGRSLYGLGSYTRSMANRRLWGTVLIGAAAILAWAYLLLEASLLKHPPQLLEKVFAFDLPLLARMVIYWRLMAVSAIALLLVLIVLWLMILAFSDVVEIIRRYMKVLHSTGNAKNLRDDRDEANNKSDS